MLIFFVVIVMFVFRVCPSLAYRVDEQYGQCKRAESILARRTRAILVTSYSALDAVNDINRSLAARGENP